MKVLILRNNLFGKLVFALLVSFLSAVSGYAEEPPSLFRGVVVADSRLGVRIVSVQENSQAYESELRPEDLIIQINDTTIKNIDDFASISRMLKGTENRADLIVLRNGSPKRLTLHIYSYPILREWGLSFVYEQGLRFAEPKAAIEYWMRMERGFEEVDNLGLALNATLNGLHYQPKNLDLALKSLDLLFRISEKSSGSKNLNESMLSLQQGLILLNHLFEYDLDGMSLKNIRDRLEAALKALQSARTAPSS